MAYELLSPIEKCDTIETTLAGTVAKGDTALIGGVIGFYHTAGVSGDKVTFVIKAPKVKAVGSALTYTAGDKVYEDPATPTGTLNKTSTNRQAVGVVQQTTAASATSMVIMFNGTGGL